MNYVQMLLALDPEERKRVITEVLAVSGFYDSGLAGPTGEAIAEKYYGLIKAPRGTKGFDGWINGKRVTVKTKEPNPARPNPFVTVKDPSLADLLMVIVLEADGTHRMAMADLATLVPSKHNQGNRYTVKKVFAKAIEEQSK